MSRTKIKYPEPLFNLPKKSGRYNFAQLKLDFHRHGYREYLVLVFSDKSQSHGEVIRTYLQQPELKHSIHLQPFPTISNQKKSPSLTGKNYHVIGLGKA